MNAFHHIYVPRPKCLHTLNQPRKFYFLKYSSKGLICFLVNTKSCPKWPRKIRFCLIISWFIFFRHEKQTIKHFLEIVSFCARNFICLLNLLYRRKTFIEQKMFNINSSFERIFSVLSTKRKKIEKHIQVNCEPTFEVARCVQIMFWGQILKHVAAQAILGTLACLIWCWNTKKLSVCGGVGGKINCSKNRVLRFCARIAFFARQVFETTFGRGVKAGVWDQNVPPYQLRESENVPLYHFWETWILLSKFFYLKCTTVPISALSDPPLLPPFWSLKKLSHLTDFPDCSFFALKMH